MEREHVLVALLEQEGGAVAEMVQQGGGDLTAARRAARDEVERVSRVEEGNEPTISPRLRKLLDEAWQEISQFKDEYLSVEHLLLAMLKAGDEPVLRVLRAANLSREHMLQALTALHGAQRTTEKRPENTSQALEKYGRDLTEQDSTDTLP